LAETRKTPHIIILAGAGGVGKTTLAASLGLMGALKNKKTLAFTIDPARRLADALGSKLDTDKPQSIPLDGLTQTRVHKDLFQAVMLNLGTVAEELVRRYSTSDKEAETIISNPIFRIGSKHMAGAEEFLALGKLHQLITDESMDLLVVDTAPTTHAQAFFQGTEQLLKILDPEVMDRIKSPINKFARSGKLSGSGAGMILGRIVTRIAGKNTVKSFLSFIDSIAGMYEGFHSRVNELLDILADPEQTSIILVTTPAISSLNETKEMIHKLIRAGLPLKTILFNRVTPPLFSKSRADRSESTKRRKVAEYAELKKELPAFLDKYSHQIKSETSLMNQFMYSMPKHLQSYRVPLQIDDVNSLVDLATLHPYLSECMD